MRGTQEEGNAKDMASRNTNWQRLGRVTCHDRRRISCIITSRLGTGCDLTRLQLGHGRIPLEQNGWSEVSEWKLYVKKACDEAHKSRK